MAFDELCYRIALTKVPGIGCVQARLLLEKFGSAQAIFEARRSHLEHTEGIGSKRAAQIKTYTDFSTAEKELAFIHRYQITPLFLTDSGYPQRLLSCYDPPTLLYVKGRIDLNVSKIVAVVGTRTPSEQGGRVAETLIQGLAAAEVTIVSGLARGIDAAAHRLALKYQTPTLGVLAHGLDYLYPYEHRSLAKQMLEEGGGLLTEFPSQHKPDKHHFPNRNRIVAGLSDALIVIESGCKGGSMLTASLANGYHKEVFAVPGRISDPKSAGCLTLIQQNQAQLFTDVNTFLEAMRWKPAQRSLQTPSTIPLFTSLPEPAQRIIHLLSNNAVLHIDELCSQGMLSPGVLAAIMLTLEMQGLVRHLPGKRYCLTG